MTYLWMTGPVAELLHNVNHPRHHGRAVAVDVQLFPGAVLKPRKQHCVKEVSIDSFDDFSPGNHQLCLFTAGKVPYQSKFRSTQQKTSRKRLGMSGMEGQDICSNPMPAVRKMEQLLGGVLDPLGP